MRSPALLSAAAMLALAACTETGPTQPLAPTAAALDVGGYQGTQVDPRGRPIRMDMTIGQDFSQGTCDLEVPTGDPENPTMLVQIPRLAPAWGTASHMGRVRQEIWHDDCGFALRDGLPIIEFGGHFQAWAADGAGNEGTWSGYMFLAGDQAGYFFNTAVITGGTRRFENASGDLVIRGWNNLGGGTPGWYTAEGTIYY